MTQSHAAPQDGWRCREHGTDCCELSKESAEIEPKYYLARQLKPEFPQIDIKKTLKVIFFHLVGSINRTNQLPF